MSASMTCSVVVPVYNSEQTLEILIQRLQAVLSQTFQDYEIILVNDGSRDNSWAVLEQLTTSYPNIHAINLMRNYGQHNALLCGIREAKHELIVTIDDDLQNPPEEIPTLLGELNKGYDVVYGSPQTDVHHNILRQLSSWIIRLVLQGAMGREVTQNISSFRMFHTQLRDGFGNYESNFVSIDVLLTWSTSRFGYIKVRHDYRLIGTSTYTLSKLVRHAVNLLTGFSTWPLQVASIIGFTFTIFGFLIFAYVVGRYLIEGSEVAGFPFLASVIAIFSGVQLFALGIIGEYILRIYQRIMNKPAYVKRKDITYDKP